MLKSGLTPKSLYKNLWDTISTGHAWEGELQNKNKNGDIFWEHAHIAPIIDNAGVAKHYLALEKRCDPLQTARGKNSPTSSLR
jgi:hypothetical protein